MTSRRVGFFDGVLAFQRGVFWVVGTPSAWKDAAAPIVIAFLIVVLLGGFGGLVTWEYEQTMPTSGMGAAVVEVLVLAVGFTLSLVVATLAAIAVAPSLAGFAMDRIAARQDELAGIVAREKRDETRAAGVMRSLRVTLTGFVVTLPLIVVLTIVSLVVPPAAVVTEPLAFLVGALAIAWDLLDRAFDRRGLGVRARLAWMRDHFAATLGFAIAAGVTLLVPGVGLLTLPMGVAGAAKLVAASESAKS